MYGLYFFTIVSIAFWLTVGWNRPILALPCVKLPQLSVTIMSPCLSPLGALDVLGTSNGCT